MKRHRRLLAIFLAFGGVLQAGDLFLREIPHDSLYSLHVIVDGIMDYGPSDILDVIVKDRVGYENWRADNSIAASWTSVLDHTREFFIQGLAQGEYAILANVRDSSERYTNFRNGQVGFSRINDKRTLLRYAKGCDATQIVFPSFDSVKFSIPETKVMRIILCNPKEGLDLTIK